MCKNFINGLHKKKVQRILFSSNIAQSMPLLWNSLLYFFYLITYTQTVFASLSLLNYNLLEERALSYLIHIELSTVPDIFTEYISDYSMFGRRMNGDIDG